MNTAQLTQKLIEETRQILNQVENLKNYELATLRWRQGPDSWSILECLEHLNLYGDFYLPQIEASIHRSRTAPEPVFRSGLLGNYFANSMLPKKKLNKMRTFKDKNPLYSTLDEHTIDRSISQQIKLLDLLTQSRKVSLNQVKIPISITRLIRLKLGDTFRFFINHNIRHMRQIEGILQAVDSPGV